MSNVESIHYHYGKEARRLGHARMIVDARLSSESRLEWYRGWDEQNAAMGPAPTDEQKREHAAFCQRLLDILQS